MQLGCAPPEKRAQGRPGARCTRGLVCNCALGKRTRAYRYRRSIPAFPAQWLYGLLRALPGERLFCHRRRMDIALDPKDRCATTQLDASTAASGPHDFAVREQLALVLRQRRVHRISPRVRDVRTPLSSGETRGVKSLICPTAKAEYFRSEHWTAFADLPVVLLCRIWRGRILLARKAKQQAWPGTTNKSGASRACETPASFG